MKITTTRLLYIISACIICCCSSILAQESRYFHYGYGETLTIKSESLEKAEHSEVYGTALFKPTGYFFKLPQGHYTVRIHTLQPSGQVDKHQLSQLAVMHEGNVVLKPHVVISTSAINKKSKTLVGTVPLSLECKVSVQDNLNLVFPPYVLGNTKKRDYPVCAIEIIQEDGTRVYGVNCGSEKALAAQDGKGWLPDRHGPFPDVPILLPERNYESNTWHNISNDIYANLPVQQGVDVLNKWGDYDKGKGITAMIAAHNGQTFIVMEGIGLWRYNGPGSEMHRVDEMKISGIVNIHGKETPHGSNLGNYLQLNYQPDGGGFAIPCYAALSSDSYNLIRTDDEENISFASPGRNKWDFGAVDWNDNPPQYLLMKEHHTPGKVWLSTDGGKNFEFIFDEPGLKALGIIGPDILIKAVSIFQTIGNDREIEKAPEKAGIYRSSDKGKTWEKVSDIDISPWTGHMVCNDGKAYLNSKEGLLVSPDKGKNWKILPNSPAFTFPVLFGTQLGHLMGMNNEGFYESLDGGENWKLAVSHPEDLNASVIHYAWNPKDDVFYAGHYPSGRWFMYQREIGLSADPGE